VDHADFGKYLSQQRELRGMSRDEVARATKIPPTLLAALEAGQVERLPERVFVLNYVRAYAQVIGLAPEDAVLRYEEVDGVPLASAPRFGPGEGVEPKVPSRIPREAMAAAVLVLLAALLVLAFTVGPLGGR
jgi:cytoskeletal protein RodZ